MSRLCVRIWIWHFVITKRRGIRQIDKVGIPQIDFGDASRAFQHNGIIAGGKAVVGSTNLPAQFVASFLAEIIISIAVKSRHTLWQIEHGDFSSIPPIEELPDTIVPSISIIYYSAGWSVGPSVDKQYAYRFAEDSTYAVNWELNDLIELVRNDPDAPGGMASRHIEGDWYIELWYDK